MEQSYSSAKTSINTISKIYTQYPFKTNTTILDYGCGKYNTSIDFMATKQCKVLPFDKYNRTENENLLTKDFCLHNHLDYIVCSNVLNVILEDEIIEEILQNIYNFADEETIVLISIYEGDKSGIGKVTSKGYQKNLRYKEYYKFIEKYFTFSIKKQIFICQKRNSGK